MLGGYDGLVQLGIMLITCIVLCIWNHIEHKADSKYFDQKIKAMRNANERLYVNTYATNQKLDENKEVTIQASHVNKDEYNESLEALRIEGDQILEAIRQEVRDFPERLCAIQERNRKA